MQGDWPKPGSDFVGHEVRRGASFSDRGRAMIEALLLGAAAVLAGPADGPRPDAVQQSASEPKVAIPARILIVEDEFLVALEVERDRA